MTELKSISTLAKAGKSILMEGIKGLDDSTPLAVFASSSTAIVAGFEGTVSKIDYEPLPENPRIPKLSQDQVITVDGKQYVGGKAGEMPWAPVITFDNARTMTLGLLQQGQKKTTIKFTEDGALTEDKILLDSGGSLVDVLNPAVLLDTLPIGNGRAIAIVPGADRPYVAPQTFTSN